MSKNEIINDLKGKALDGAFDGVIDLVGNTITTERHFGATHRVCFIRQNLFLLNKIKTTKN